MSTQSKKVVIIGGGIVGGLTAYFLAKRGCSVTLLEKEHFGSGASHGNCGLIVPGHGLPLNTPANLILGIRWMFTKNAPLFIPWRFDAAWIRWAIQFARHCFGPHPQRAMTGRTALITDAIDAYDTLIKEEGIDCDWQITGNCHLFRNKKEAEAYAASHTPENSGKSPLERLSESKRQQWIPTLSSGVTDAWYDPKAANIRPDSFMRALARILKNMGVTIHEEATWQGFHRENGGEYKKVQAAHTNQGTFSGDAFVVATGAWTPLHARDLGCRIPIQPGKGYSVTTKRPAAAPSLPCFFETERVVLTPWANGLRLGGTMAFTGYDDRLDPGRIASLFKALENYMPLPVSDHVEETWCSWRPMTWDGLPVIDYLPGCPNVILAAGHNELGITMGPATGKLVAEMVHQETPHVDPSVYRISRFTE